jgi:hypothetical protein
MPLTRTGSSRDVKAAMDRWAIHIDVEGFGTLYDHHDDVLLALGALMEGIYRIGTAVFPDSPDRLFAHQYRHHRRTT